MWVQLFWFSALLDLCYGWTFWKVERNVLTEWCVKELECQINGKTFLNEGCVHRLESEAVGLTYQGGAEFQEGLEEKPARIKEYTREVLNEKQKKEILKLHNDYRNSVAGGSKGLPKASNVRQLTWNDNLEISAAITAWGSSLYRYDPTFLCTQRCHRPTSICLKTPDFEQATQIRQTFTPYPKPFLTSIMDFFKVILSQPVDDLKTRIPKYNKPSNYATEFLPRMLWAETYKIGCVDVSTSMIWYGEHTKFYSRSHVCNYAPEGTIEGQPVYKEGETCSACPEGTKCRPESLYPNLCATDRDPMNDDLYASGATQPLTTWVHLLLLNAVAINYFHHL